jgi:hypothetical protein
MNFKAGDLVVLLPRSNCIDPPWPYHFLVGNIPDGTPGSIIEPCSCGYRSEFTDYPRWHVLFLFAKFMPLRCASASRLRKIEPPQACDGDFDWRRIEGDEPILVDSAEHQETKP